MGILDFIFRRKYKLPICKIISFERFDSKFDIVIGEELDMWNKPNTDQINLYTRGSIGGSGFVGRTRNSIISHHLRKTNYLFIETKIIRLTNSRIDLLVNMFANKQAVIDSQKLPFYKTVKFERIDSEFYIEIGEELILWNKPGTDQVNLYARGSIAGSGLVGVTRNSIISHHLGKTKYLFVETKIVGLTKSRIDLLVNMFADEQAVIRNQELQRSKWIKKVQKKYNPKTCWELRFYSDIKLNKNELNIKTISKNEINEYYECKDETVWLTNNNGLKLAAESRIRGGGIEKTLRAVFTGHELEIKDIILDYNWCYLTVGIKKNAT